MKVHFSLYDKDGQLVYADKVQFMEKKGSVIADKENTSTARLIRTLNSKDVFEPKTNDGQEKNTSELKEEKTELNKESIKEHIQKENLNELSQEEARNLYHEYVQHYQANEFDLSPFELSAMVKLVVENQLDKDDDKKFSRTVVLKDPVQKANDVKIKATGDNGLVYGVQSETQSNVLISGNTAEISTVGGKNGSNGEIGSSALYANKVNIKVDANKVVVNTAKASEHAFAVYSNWGSNIELGKDVNSEVQISSSSEEKALGVAVASAEGSKVLEIEDNTSSTPTTTAIEAPEGKVTIKYLHQNYHVSK